MESSSLDTASFYKRAIAAFELPPERAEKIAAQMHQLGVGRDNEYMMLFLASARAEMLTETIPEEIDKAGIEIIKNMRAALDGALENKLKTVPQMLEKQMGDITKIVASEVNSRLTVEASRRQKHRQGMLAVVAALVVLLAFGQGYIFGSDAVDANASKWEAIANLEDGGTWLGLAQNNDIKKVLAQTCGLGERRVQAGGEKCDLSLWLTPPVATSKGADTIRLSFVEWTNWLGVWGLLGIGALFGYAFRSVRR
ncbi:hypothetical protein [Ensifer aridi]|uniref:hypothetical protein n=1 Tax=Ensifer aridi TaxID=1708715 RepID=UPI000A11C4E8|nr:hypothetical protein [Ensifer aridi]